MRASLTVIGIRWVRFLLTALGALFANQRSSRMQFTLTMSKFGNTNYSADTSSSSNNNDFKDREPFLLSTYSIITFTLADVGVYGGDYGDTLILNMDDVEVLEGVVGNRIKQNGEDCRDKTKVFDWGRWFDRDDEMELMPFDEDGEVSTAEIGRRVTDEAGSNTYKYEIEEGVLEVRDDPVEIGDKELWLSNQKKSRTLAKVLSERGHDAVDDDNKTEDYGWLTAENQADFALRPELEGREIMMWFEEVTLEPEEDNDIEEEVTFRDSVILDAETETGIVIQNDEESENAAMESTTTSQSQTATDGGMATPDNPYSDVDLPTAVDSLIDSFAASGTDNRDSIENVVSDAAPDDYELDMDVVMSELRSRMD